MRALGVVELKSLGERVEDALGDATEIPVLHARVVVDADAGKDRHLLPSQPRHPPCAIGGETRLFRRDEIMSDEKVWFITGAGRGMGTGIAKAALDAGHAVVATGRDTDAVTEAIGEHDDLFVVRLDVTSPDEAEAAVKAAVERIRPP